MLEALKFVDRATADKDIIRALTHICVHDGMLQGADSKMAMEHACPELAGWSFTVPAEKFIRAVTACDNEPKIEKLETDQIKISKGRFHVKLPVLKVSDYPRAELKTTTAQQIECPDGFVTALKRIFPFVSQDASRPWSLGIWLSNGYAYATNNVILVRTPLNWTGAQLNIPRYAVEEIINITRPIKALWADKNALGVEYENAWFKAQTYVDEWPAAIAERFGKNVETIVPEGLMKAIEKLIPFCPDVKLPTIYFKEGVITTANGAHSAEIGFDWNVQGVYRAEVLQLVLGAATHWDPSTYPGPIYFKGEKLEGMFVGIRP